MINTILKNKKLILVCGSGGVGKTTIAAALALQSAALGKKTIVLTIDPAKRLATSLGLESLSDEPKRVEGATGEFWAMMLDTKRTFDYLVEKFSPDGETTEKIFNNKIYKHLSNMMAGSQEYMAMEKLYEIVSSNEYEVVIVDTPPTIHALDFLEAPERMMNMMSNSMIHLLIKPASIVGKSSFRFFQRGTNLILKVFDRITGFAFLQDISEMLVAFQGLLKGFENRAGDVLEILKDSKTSFLLVSACESTSLEEAGQFIHVLKYKNFQLDGVLLNRVHPFFKRDKNQLNEDQKNISAIMGAPLAEKMISVFDLYQQTALRDSAFRKKFSKELACDQFLLKAPLFQSDIHNLKNLLVLGESIQ